MGCDKHCQNDEKWPRYKVGSFAVKALKRMFIKKIGIDLGTTNTLVFVPGKGLVINEPSVVAISMLDNKIIAGALFLSNKYKAIYFQSFSSREHTEKQAPSLIQWIAIQKFKRMGVEEYDFGGVTLGLDDNDSRFFVYEFKRKFNGELKKFYNIEIEINKWKKIQDPVCMH